VLQSAGASFLLAVLGQQEQPKSAGKNSGNGGGFRAAFLTPIDYVGWVAC